MKGRRREAHRSASALRFSKGCSSLNLDRMLMMFDVLLGQCDVVDMEDSEVGSRAC
jgi:hypothetical protein